MKAAKIPKEGLLYLPNPYVAPGGRFNEMYGDSYLILLGLVQGLARYGIKDDAAKKFMTTVAGNYKTDGTIREKYNVVSGSANVGVAAGYTTNVIGFGWTDSVYLKMQAPVSGDAAMAASGAN